MGTSVTKTSTNGLDAGVSAQLLAEQTKQNKANQEALTSMHHSSMQAMKDAMGEMRAAQQSSDAKFQQLVVSMQRQSSEMMGNMTMMMRSMMDMMGPAMMGGMGGMGGGGGVNVSIMGGGSGSFFR